MKNSKTLMLLNILPIMFILLCSSCESPVGFTKAQPEGREDLKSFPVAFRGAYICAQDSILIRVESDIIYSEYTEIAFTPIKYVQNRRDCKIINDSLHMEGKKECIKVEYMKGGLLSAVKVSLDTIFQIKPYQKARMYKGRLVLSQRTQNGLWTVGLLELDRDKGVLYKAITEDSDLDQLGKITQMTEIAQNSEGWPTFKIAPKKVELDALFNDPAIFVDCNYYSRVQLIQ